MSEDLMITQQDLIDWIDRPPSNDDLDLATFISTRLEKFYDLEHQLQQKENIMKEVRKKLVNLNDKFKTISGIPFNVSEIVEMIEILDKENK